MRNFRRVLSLILCVTLIAGLIPESVKAQPSNVEEANECAYDCGDVTVIYRETASWGNKVNVSVEITNEGDSALSDWNLYMDYEGSIETIWNAE
ncbi:MAG: cellulose-binding domain-containing protein, partial [Lachnospiraceae bacterium]|nr:cellulose-binding domain-containing protein [Lachnospiraceae bacterium]